MLQIIHAVVWRRHCVETNRINHPIIEFRTSSLQKQWCIKTGFLVQHFGDANLAISVFNEYDIQVIPFFV